MDDTAQKQFHAVSLSGGKDSTAMLLLMMERDMLIDLVLTAETGMEFPEMYEHLERLDQHLYRERGITEKEALQICYDRGYDWNGLYEIYHRCSCWCCPLQRIGELRKLRSHHPELWERLREMDRRAIAQFGRNPLGQFKQNWTVDQLERRFAAEEAQISVFHFAKESER